MNNALDADLVIAGAGPAGLSLAAALADAPLRILLIERTNFSDLCDPQFDGREIALTQRSIQRLRQVGALEHVAKDDIVPLKSARVLNGQSPFALHFNSRDANGAIGALVSNAAIRRALIDVVRAQANCTLLAGQSVASFNGESNCIATVASGGQRFRSRLAVAADTRFSPLRQSQGIGAHMVDFGRTMLVCRMTHATPHEGIATEWFGKGQTIAMLPLQENTSSYVLTLPAREIEAIMQMAPRTFALDAQRRTYGRWGAMTLASARHAYPLVAVYADRFCGQRFALVGDAAVGMHPVTAHGYNFGLASAFRLAREVRDAVQHRADIGRAEGLLRYERAHRRATWPLFAATNALAKLYSDERLLPRLARSSGLRLMAAVSPVRRALEARLSA